MADIQALLCGYYGYGNGGDEALLASLLQMLPDNVRPIVLSGNPNQTRDRYGVDAIPRMNALSVLPVLRQCDAFIWGGGSLIQDATSALSPLYYSGLMGIAQRLGLKTIAWAQGIGPLKRSFTRQLAKRSFSGCTSVSVRDRASASWLQNWNIPCYLAPDPVWALDAKPVAGLWDLPAPRVAVSLRSHPQLTPERVDLLTRALVDFQKATGTYILLLPFQQSQDLAIAQSIEPHLKGGSKILSLEDPRELKGVFKGVEMAIGMRFHALIMAAAEGCRCFAISYDPKVSQLMVDLDLPGWELAQLPNDSHAIGMKWIDCYANGESCSEAQIQSLIDRSLIHREILREALR